MGPDCQIASYPVSLRTFTPEDAEKLYTMSLEADLQKWILSQVYRNLDHAREVLAYLISQYQGAADPRTHSIVFGIVQTGSSELIGHVGLSPFRDTVEIGFAIEDSQKRKGYATAAVKEICRWAVNEYKLAKIHGFVARDNEASKRVLRRAGFTFVEQRTMPFQGDIAVVDVFVFTGTNP